MVDAKDGRSEEVIIHVIAELSLHETIIPLF